LNQLTIAIIQEFTLDGWNKRLVQWIITGNTPFLAIENMEFQEFCQYSCHSVADKLLKADALHEKTMAYSAELREELKELLKVS
jgi:hypothetical protein